MTTVPWRPARSVEQASAGLHPKSVQMGVHLSSSLNFAEGLPNPGPLEKVKAVSLASNSSPRTLY